ncbi:MAG: hypothetical protein E4H13_00070 [Calditrichales bacterium]|nr:MAG: hypothetical protein E4H13_00070 [Calditrichales bacterium]
MGKTNNFKLIIHGGAWDIPPEVHQDHMHGVKRAAEIGSVILKSGGSAIAAVLAAVKYMEDNPTFDAGCGSFLNRDGDVEMDAIIMDGRDLSLGAVAAIQNVSNPVEVANLVRLNSDHTLLVGAGAGRFAREQQVPFIPTEKLLFVRELERYRELQKITHIKTRQFFEEQSPSDTVGAVAFDLHGDIAVATSTGGAPNKLPGRVGDSPLVGSGAYADNFAGGASTTGWGESIMKVVLAKTAVDMMNRNLPATQAAKEAIQYLHSRVDGRGGVICIDRNGDAGFYYNTPFMARAIADKHGIIHVGINLDSK